MEKHDFVSGDGNEDIYLSKLVTKPESKPGALEAPVFEDVRGRIERLDFQGAKYNLLETKKGFMRSGDLHKNTQFDLILAGKAELWTLVDNVTQKTVVGPNQLIVLKPHVPHLFNFLEDTIMIEYWNGPFETWFYTPYRDIIDKQFRKVMRETD